MRPDYYKNILSEALNANEYILTTIIDLVGQYMRV